MFYVSANKSVNFEMLMNKNPAKALHSTPCYLAKTTKKLKGKSETLTGGLVGTKKIDITIQKLDTKIKISILVSSVQGGNQGCASAWGSS